EARDPVEVTALLSEAPLDLGELAVELGEVRARGVEGGRRVAIVALGLLRQERDDEAAPLRHLAGVCRLLAGGDAERRRLAAAVRPDHAQAGARLDVEVEPVEDRARAEALADAARGEQRHADQTTGGGTRARPGGGSRRPTGGRRPRCTTRASCGRARPGPRACRGTRAPARRAGG